MNSYRGAGNRLAAFLSFVFIGLAVLAMPRRLVIAVKHALKG